MEEIIDVVDEDNNFIEKLPKDEAHKRNLIHKTSHILLFNSRGEMLLQKRADDKKIAPGLWTSSASGYLASGESYEEAAHKGLKEELGIDTSIKKIGEVKCYYDNHKNNITIFVGKHDGPFIINKKELSEVEFVKIGKLKREIRLYKRKISPEFSIVFKEFCKIKSL